MMCVVSANLGNFDAPLPHVAQEWVGVSYALFTDVNMPPRPKAMTPRLQAKIPKMFAWDMRPDFESYLWIDASLCLSKPDSAAWFLEQLGTNDIVVFRHPHRKTIHEEAAFVRRKIEESHPYLVSRYAGEDIDGQIRAIERDPFYVDDHLYNAGAFCYRPTEKIKAAMTEWWVHTTRFHCIDQLAFSYVLRHCAVSVINEKIHEASHLAWTRKKGHG